MNVHQIIDQLIRQSNANVDIWRFSLAVGISALVGILISALYQAFYENRATGAQVHRAFLLMAPSITALFIAIQFSLPLSLGLLGALSVIRFRTPIKEPEEIAFILLLIAASVVCATFQFILLGVLLLTALILLTLQKMIPRLTTSRRKDGTILVTLGPGASDAERRSVLGAIDRLVKNGRLESVSTDDEAVTLSYSFTGFDPAALGDLEKGLGDSVPVERINVFFNRHGALF